MTSQENDQLLELVEAIYQAGCNPADWQRVADMCQALVPGSAFSQLVAVPDRFESSIPVSSGWPPEYLSSYLSYYHTINPYPALLATVPPGNVVLAKNTVDPGWQRRQAFFNDWAMPAGNFTGGASLTLFRAPNSYTRLSFDIPERYRSHEEWAGNLLSQIGPHIRRALELNARLDAAALGQGLSAALLEMIDGAAIVVDRKSRIMAQNKRADALLADNRLIHCRASRLSFKSAVAEQAFRAALDSSTTIPQLVSASAFAPGPGPNPPHRALVLPLRLARGAYAAISAAPLALVLINTGEARTGIARTVLRSIYGLTVSELRVVEEIVAGASLEEAAERHAVSRVTLRNQLAAAMHKLGVRRQGELVAFVAGFTPSIGPDA